MDPVAYLENRQGGITQRGRTLVPKGRAVERAPPVPRAIFVDIFGNTFDEKMLLTFFSEQPG